MVINSLALILWTIQMEFNEPMQLKSKMHEYVRRFMLFGPPKSAIQQKPTTNELHVIKV